MSVAQSAIVDSTLTIALISLTTSLLTTFGALLVKGYVDNKRDNRLNAAQKLEFINTKVYSPLLFRFLEAADNLSFLSGCLEGFIETKEYEVEENRRLIIKELKEKSDLHSNSIREILFEKIALIKPRKFRQKFFFFAQYLKMYEDYVKQFTDSGFNEGFIEQDLKFIENLHEASLVLSTKTASFIGYIEAIIEDEGKAKLVPDMFSNDEMQRLSDLITSRNILIAQEVEAKELLKKTK
jgi:hypothetical protein